MAAGKYKTGDFVRLKSGGPKMTVSSYNEFAKAYDCKWFVGAKLNEGRFEEGEIEPWREE
jgi:uncharacterized protein YodC (DUF2158 family)